MTALVLFVVFGFVGGWLVSSFMESRTSLSFALSLVLGVIGSFTAGLILFMFGAVIFGSGFDFIASMLGAAIAGIVLPLIASIIKK